MPPGLFRNRLTQPFRPPGNCVLIDVGFNRGARSSLDFFRGREIREALRQIDRTMLCRLPRHITDD